MEFGICFKGDISPKRTVALARQAEVAGFSYGWFFDSHILWRSPYVTMAMCMEHTEKMRFGPCVTNPGVRDWSDAASIFATALATTGAAMEVPVGWESVPSGRRAGTRTPRARMTTSGPVLLQLAAWPCWSTAPTMMKLGSANRVA